MNLFLKAMLLLTLDSLILASFTFFRFSIALMEDFFKGSTNNSLAKSVSISRSVCKLKHLVGCAPVCYGIPVHLHK